MGSYYTNSSRSFEGVVKDWVLIKTMMQTRIIAKYAIVGLLLKSWQAPMSAANATYSLYQIPYIPKTTN
jgi:hypothetical protein